MRRQKGLLLFTSLAILVALIFLSYSAAFRPNQTDPVLFIGLTPQYQNGLAQLVNTWYTNFNVNVTVAFANTGAQQTQNGTVTLSLSVPSKAWTISPSYAIPALQPGQTYYSYFFFTPREDGLYVISVDQSHTSINATIQGGFLPLEVAPSSAWTTLSTEVIGVALTIIAIVVGAFVSSRRSRR